MARASRTWSPLHRLLSQIYPPSWAGPCPAILQAGLDLSTAEPGRRLDLDLDINTSWQIEPHQSLNRLCARFQHINQTPVGTDLKLLS